MNSTEDDLFLFKLNTIASVKEIEKLKKFVRPNTQLRDCEIESVTKILKSIVYEFESHDYQTFSENFYKTMNILKIRVIAFMIIHFILFLIVSCNN